MFSEVGRLLDLCGMLLEEEPEGLRWLHQHKLLLLQLSLSHFVLNLHHRGKWHFISFLHRAALI